MKKIKLPVTWEAFGFVEVKANSIEEAIEYFKKNSDHISLPKESEYVDDSFRLNDEDPDFIKLYQ